MPEEFCDTLILTAVGKFSKS